MLFALHFKVVSSILTIFSRSEGKKNCYYSLQFHSEWFETNIFSSQTLYIFTHAAPVGRDDPNQTLYIFTHAAPVGRDDPNQTLYIFTHAAPVGRDDPNQTLYIFTHAAPVGRDDPNQTLYIFTHAAPVGRDDPNQTLYIFTCSPCSPRGKGRPKSKLFPHLHATEDLVHLLQARVL